MTTTRRNMLKMTAAVPVLALVPLAPIPDLAPLKTLEQLTAEGKYISVLHGLPCDTATAEWEFHLNGTLVDHTEVFLKEIYAPGDDTGWAVVYRPMHDKQGRPTGRQVGETELIHGNWHIKRLDHDSSRHRT